jgi:hypothetical protein
MRTAGFIVAIMLASGSGYGLALIFAAENKLKSEAIDSKVIRRAETRRNTGDWGVMDM